MSLAGGEVTGGKAAGAELGRLANGDGADPSAVSKHQLLAQSR